MAAGAIFAVKELNAKGGILGRQIELLVEDDQGRPDISATAARKLVDPGAAFILSVSLTPATPAAGAVGDLEESRRRTSPCPTAATRSPPRSTTPISGRPARWARPRSPRCCCPTPARRTRRRWPALVTENSDLGQLTNRFFKAGIEKAGMGGGGRGGGAARLHHRRAADAVRAAAPDAIFLTGVLARERPHPARHCQLGLKAPLLGNYTTSQAPQTAVVAKGLLDGVVFVDAFDPAKPERCSASSRPSRRTAATSPTTSTAMATTG